MTAVAIQQNIAVDPFSCAVFTPSIFGKMIFTSSSICRIPAIFPERRGVAKERKTVHKRI